MKYIMIILIFFVSCKTKKVEERETLILTDTTVRVNADTAWIVPVPPVKAAPVRHHHHPVTRRTNVSPYTGRRTTDNTTSYPVQQQRREGWSKAAKGAVIGGVVGAGTGAIITKSGKGAVIGGAVGAAGGYIIGRGKDKRDGRVN